MVIKIFSLSPWLETSEQVSVFQGLPWWLSGKGSICNKHRGHGFKPQVRKSP